MLRCLPALRQSFVGDHFERSMIAQNHLNLLNEDNWTFSLPSKSVPVLHLLVRSGTLVENLDKVTALSFSPLYPCMTRSERSVLHNFYSMFPEKSFAHNLGLKKDPNKQVREVYYSLSSNTERTSCHNFLATLNIEVIEHLHISSALMLLELFLSDRGSIPSLVNLVRAVTNRVQNILEDQNQIDATLSYVWWLLAIMRIYECIPSSKELLPTFSRIFATCVQLVHNVLPSLELNAKILAYLSLHGHQFLEPFVVLNELEKTIMESSLVAFCSCNTTLLLSLLQSTFAHENTILCKKLLFSLHLSGRVSEMSKEEALATLSSLARLHLADPKCTLHCEDSSFSEWECFHNSLFAQLYSLNKTLSLFDSAHVLDEVEVINVSCWEITAPMAFVVKVKRRVFYTSKQIIDSNEEEEALLDKVMETLLRFRALLQRCTVVPFSEKDLSRVTEYIEALKKRL